MQHRLCSSRCMRPSCQWAPSQVMRPSPARLQATSTATEASEVVQLQTEASEVVQLQSLMHRCVPVCSAALLLSLACPEASMALQMEPENALSLPTWAIHLSSVAEWVIAMGLMWKYAEVSGNPRWKGMTWGMLPSLGSALTACTWHFFYNAPELEYLVAQQAFLTVVGNVTCMIAAYRIYAGAQSEAAGQ